MKVLIFVIFKISRARLINISVIDVSCFKPPAPDAPFYVGIIKSLLERVLVTNYAMQVLKYGDTY